MKDPIDAAYASKSSPADEEAKGKRPDGAKAAEGEDKADVAEEYLAALTPAQEEVLAKIKKLHEERAEYEREYDLEWNKLKAKYLRLYEPLYAQRRDLLGASVSGAEGDANAGKTALPNFWLHALTNNKSLSELIEQHDEPILKYLKNISSSWEDETRQDAYTLRFEFAQNPYFTPLTLEKSYVMACAPDSDESILMSTRSTKIEWKEGKNVTVKKVTRKQRNVKTRQLRTIEETVDNSSFFNFFSNHSLPNEAQLQKLTEEEIAEFELTIEADYEVGVILREKIIPHAYLWYINQGDDMPSEYGESDDSSDEDDVSDSDPSDNESENSD